MKEIIKTIFGIATSPEIVRIFDKDGNGVVSWGEIKGATGKEKLKALSIIGGDLVMKYGWVLLTLL